MKKKGKIKNLILLLFIGVGLAIVIIFGSLMLAMADDLPSDPASAPAAMAETAKAYLIMVVVGIVIMVVFGNALKNRIRATCPSCKQYYGTMEGDVHYEYAVSDYEPGTSSNGVGHYTFTITVICPECGAERQFSKKFSAKTQAAAELACNRYVRDLLRLKK